MKSTDLQGGWDAAFKAMGGKPPLNEVIEAIEGNLASSGESAASFYCPLHDDNNASGWLSWGYDTAEPEKYSIACYGCGGDDGEWFGDFLRWMKGDAPIHTWNGLESSGGSRSGRGRGIRVNSTRIASYEYENAVGDVVGVKDRLEHLYEIGVDACRSERAFAWSRDFPLSGSRVPLYRLPAVLAAIAAGEPVYVVEGEKDADTMTALGFAATTGPNGAGTPWTGEQIESLTGAKVVVIADNDAPGRTHAREIAGCLKGVAALVDLQVPVGYKDVTEIAEAGGEVLGTLEELLFFRPHINPLDFPAHSIKPAYFLDESGRSVIYPAEIHWVYGKPGTMKSFVALTMTLAHDARYLDFENGQGVIGDRMRKMGALRLGNAKFDFPESKEALESRIYEYTKTKPEIVIIDGLPGLAGLLGCDADNNTEVQRIFKEYLYPLKKAGIAVVVLDHLPKDSGTEEYPIGAQTKRSQSGVTILLKQTARSIDVFITKDRHGELESRCDEGAVSRKYGRIEASEESGNLRIVLKPVLEAEIDGQKVGSRDASLRTAMWQYIDAHPDSTKKDIETHVEGKTSTKREALQSLVDSGHVTQTKVSTAFVHRVAKALDVAWQAKSGNSPAHIALPASWTNPNVSEATDCPDVSEPTACPDVSAYILYPSGPMVIT